MNNTNKMTLICLPFAGAGASFFNEWKPESDTIEIQAIQLPGREKRFLESPHTDVRKAAESVCEEILAMQIDFDEDPVVLFGHSLGAVLAFEVALGLQRHNVPLTALVVSGSPDPWTPRNERATGLADDEFIERVFEFSEYKHEALENEMMRELLLPALRADVEMHESYIATADTVLDIPVLALRGSDDRLVSAEQTRHWQKASKQKVEFAEMEGMHMFFVDKPKTLLSLIETYVASKQLICED